MGDSKSAALDYKRRINELENENADLRKRIELLESEGRMVRIGSVRVFADVESDKAQALKIIEEAAEAFAAWQEWDSGDGCDPFALEDLMDECADVIQAVANMAHAIGYHDLGGIMERCEARNMERGRYGA